MSTSVAKNRAAAALRAASQLYALPTAGARSLPGFLIIGAQRAGTTSLYRYLVQHPGVMPATLRRKGAHYFDTNYGRGLRWYRSHFPTTLAMHARARHAGVPRVITGEGNPYYVFHPLVPRRVRELIPDARLILVLRDPVSRAYSHHQHEVARGFETLSFEEAIDAEPARLEGEEARMVEDPTYYSYAHQHHSYLARGRYLEQIERWHALFPRDQLLVVDSAELFSDPDAGFREVLRFLDLPELSLSSYEQHNARSYDKMATATRERLNEHFAEANRHLAEYLGRRFRWSG